MTRERQSLNRDEPGTARRARHRRRGWFLGLSLAGLGAVMLAGASWNWHRPETRFRRGRQAVAKGDRQTVLRESQRLIATPGFETRGRLLVGLFYARTGRPRDALGELQFAARDDAVAVEALTAAAECYYALGQYVEVVNLSRTALVRDDTALDARRWLAAALYDLGATSAAVTELQSVADGAPDDARPDRLLGLIYKDNERFPEAVAHYRESLRRSPHQPERKTIILELAESLVKLNLFDQALETLHECDRTAPALTLSGLCARSLGQLETADDRLREALDVDPSYLPAKLERGTLLLLLHSVAEAVDMLEDAVRQAPYSSQAHYHLAQAYVRHGERDKADTQMRLFQEVQEIDREFNKLHAVASQSPTDSEARFRLGVLAGRLGKPELAQMWFRATLAIQPAHPGARAELEEADAVSHVQIPPTAPPRDNSVP